MNLDFEITPGKNTNPETLLIYGPPKVGKTTEMAKLTRMKNFLLIDLEPKDGSKYVEGRKVNIVNWKKENYPKLQDWQAFLMLITGLESTDRYEGIIIDNLSRLEDYCKEWAMRDWNATQTGVSVQNKRKAEGIDPIRDPYNIPGEMGSPGYGLVREKFMHMKYLIEKTSDKIVYVGHTKLKLKPKSHSEDEDVEIQTKELDLTGQMKRIMMQHVSCIGYFYRPGGKMMISTKSDESIAELGSRVPRLDNFQGELDWNHIYKNNEDGSE